MNLLIVEDEPSTRFLLERIFVNLGHHVSSAADGFSALEQIRHVVPDVIVSDLNMPGMSGFELLSVVRRRLPGIYVIATSGAYSGDKIPYGIAADAFYEKATSLHTLLAMMETANLRQHAPTQRINAFAPIWISRFEEESAIKISCPECLRVFPQTVGDQRLLIHETTCPSCLTPVHYAMVQPLDPLTSQPFVVARIAPGLE